MRWAHLNKRELDGYGEGEELSPTLFLLVAIFVQDLKEEENITFSLTKAHSQSTFTVAVAMQPILISSQMRSDDWTTSRSEQIPTFRATPFSPLDNHLTRCLMCSS